MYKEKTNLLIGKSESGKNSTLLKEVEELIDNNENLLILDNKEEYYKTYGKVLKENGYDVLVLNLNNTSKSNGFNPLSLPYTYYKNGNKNLATKIINDIAHSIFVSNANMDPFWDNAASDYFTALTLTLFENGSKEEINLGSILAMMAKGTNNEGTGGIFYNYLKTLEPLNPIYMYGSSTEFAPYETKMSILSVARQKLNSLLISEDLINVISSDDIDLSKLKEKTAIFIIGTSNLNCIANILITEIINITKENNYKLNLVLDNFDTLPLLSNLKEMIDNAGYYNIKLYLAIKDINEMEFIYGKFVFSHIANIINITNSNDNIKIGTYNEYPTMNKKSIKYFDIEKLK